ncbi:hypothetical protein BD31_I0648 [Candidatus Nitrosopumilus salaria BD31]|uniref:Uncharacterized protein n=1 Tax=Candidatus Nitrosopumilus salarius BD31 TaxID=859350 RepID=I3D1Q1_9ARCH|nr:hypothetical protein [Candidatus Nitrosopumilus salaria]EIJ65644.1 hypothetical protein BD31_I0648 [Candidatus Nitrosopumilus salaria BD31]
MNKGIIIGIIAVIGVLVVLGVVLSFEKSDTMEVEDVLNKEITPEEETTPEIQDKLDEIEKINLENEYSPKPREWITSGPFQIDRSEYLLGEKIFVLIGGLNYDEKGQIVFLRPLNSTHYSVYWTIPFDGAKKPAFNYYLQPQLSKSNGYCTVDDFIGDWRVVFRGTDYPNLEFKITKDILPGEESNYQSVC